MVTTEIILSGTSLTKLPDTMEKNSIIRKNLVPTGLVTTFLPLKEENLFIIANSAQNSGSQNVRNTKVPL